MINLLNLNKILLSKLFLDVSSFSDVCVCSLSCSACCYPPALTLCWFCCHSLILLNAFFSEFCFLHQRDGEGQQQNSPSHLFTHGSYIDLFPQCRKNYQKSVKKHHRNTQTSSETHQKILWGVLTTFFSLKALWKKSMCACLFSFLLFPMPIKLNKILRNWLQYYLLLAYSTFLFVAEQTGQRSYLTTSSEAPTLNIGWEPVQPGERSSILGRMEHTQHYRRGNCNSEDRYWQSYLKLITLLLLCNA